MVVAIVAIQVRSRRALSSIGHHHRHRQPYSSLFVCGTLFARALAARAFAFLFSVLEVGGGFEERQFLVFGAVEWGLFQGQQQSFAFAWAAFLLVFDVTSGFGALELAFGTWASGGFGARPRARGLFAQWRTVGFRGNASGVALGRSANSFTLGARVLLAHVFRATD